jgi:homoserine dehydrogenase
MKTVKIGLIGFGTVGSGVYRLLKKNSGIIKDRTGVSIELRMICDLDEEKVRKETSGVKITSRWEDIVNDDEIDIVIELIGGIEPARTIILKALEREMSVVTANKKLLAENAKDFFRGTIKDFSKLRFEAAVCGGIPCILALKEGLVGNRVKSLKGILNGTTNYILTRMSESGLSFADALRDAQSKGFAEADPTFDIEGYDAGHKTSILAMLSFNRMIDFSKVKAEGITSISERDIAYAAEMGYTIKLLGIAKEISGRLDIRVHPTMLPKKHPLASVRDEFNAVMFDCDMTGPVTFHGRGAGSDPTASSVVSDIVQIADRESLEENIISITGEAEYITDDERISRYYLRLFTTDNPGILSKVSGVIGKHGISIASVIQKDTDGDLVPLMIMTHEAPESQMMKAVEEINNFEFVDSDLMLIRVED